MGESTGKGKYAGSMDAKRLQAVALLAQGESQAQTARTVGIHIDTLKDWIRKPEFFAEVEAQKERIRQLILDPAPYVQGLLYWKQELPGIMEALADTAKDKNSPRQVKAAEVILNFLKVDEMDTHGQSRDERVIQEYFQKNGWAAPMLESAACDDGVNHVS